VKVEKNGNKVSDKTPNHDIMAMIVGVITVAFFIGSALLVLSGCAEFQSAQGSPTPMYQYQQSYYPSPILWIQRQNMYRQQFMPIMPFGGGYGNGRGGGFNFWLHMKLEKDICYPVADELV
jgi:hypothetical protein